MTKKIVLLLFLFTFLLCFSLKASYSQENDISYYNNDFTASSGDIAYRDERCKLDVYYSNELKNLPVVVWFHGGGLSEGEKFIPDSLKNSKLVVVGVNYRLSGKRAKAPDYLEDAAAAIKWTYDNISKFEGNPKQIYISGGSAGA